jgi:hypothetical protein
MDSSGRENTRTSFTASIYRQQRRDITDGQTNDSGSNRGDIPKLQQSNFTAGTATPGKLKKSFVKEFDDLSELKKNMLQSQDYPIRKSKSGFLLSGSNSTKLKKLTTSDEQIDENLSDTDSSGFSP